MKTVIHYILFALALGFSLSLLQNFVKNIVALAIAKTTDAFSGLMMNRPLMIIVVLLWTAFYIL